MNEIVERAQAMATETFLASTGPGGQNVNKVASACQLRLDCYALRLSPEVFARLKELAGSRMTLRGELVISARRFRTQEANRADARERMAELLEQAQKFPEKRQEPPKPRRQGTAHQGQEIARQRQSRPR